MNKEKLAQTIVDNLSSNPKFDIYAEMHGDEPMWVYRIEVIDFCDCKTVVANYWGGGSPVICDFTARGDDGKYCQSDVEFFQESFYRWLALCEFDERIYVDLNTNHSAIGN